MKFSIISLGCPKNLTNSEEFTARLIGKGHELLLDPAGVDVLIINTCGFIASAVQEAEDEIRHALQLKEKGLIKKVAVTGCMVERYKEKILQDFPQLDLVFSISEQEKIEKTLQKSGLQVSALPKTLHLPEYKMSLTAEHTAYLKVADGCNNRCAYCTIPFLRGPYRSKPMEDILREAELMTDNGVKEISLIAQDTTSYGQDLYGTPQLVQLLRNLLQNRRIKRLRIMYAYPHRVSKELADLIASTPRIFHYLDIPLQHIADPVLRRMNRHCDGSQIRRTLDMLKKQIPDISLRTNFIVGFPGETEEDFRQLQQFVNDYEFDNMGVFEYFREPGTTAHDLAGQISPALKQERRLRLEETQSRVIDRLNTRLQGQVLEAIADGPTFGRTYKDAPDIDGQVRFTRPVQTGRIFKARVVETDGYKRTLEPLK